MVLGSADLGDVTAAFPGSDGLSTVQVHQRYSTLWNFVVHVIDGISGQKGVGPANRNRQVFCDLQTHQVRQTSLFGTPQPKKDDKNNRQHHKKKDWLSWRHRDPTVSKLSGLGWALQPSRKKPANPVDDQNFASLPWRSRVNQEILTECQSAARPEPQISYSSSGTPVWGGIKDGEHLLFCEGIGKHLEPEERGKVGREEEWRCFVMVSRRPSRIRGGVVESITTAPPLSNAQWSDHPKQD